MTNVLEDRVKRLPRKPGVYLMKDTKTRVIYVGKAVDLRARVSSYFAASRPAHPRTDALVERIHTVDVIVTETELDALLVEQSLIKQYRPRYNVNLKDDKRFPYLRLSLAHPHPGIEVTRNLSDKRSKYFGPYTDVASLRHTVKRLRRAFPIRVCSDHRVAQRDKRECLDYFIGSCSAPCTGRVTDAEYATIIQDFTRFLSGGGNDVLAELEREMADASASKNYERAAVFRDRIQAARSVLRRQNVETPGGEDVDVIGVASRDDDATGVVLRVRGGKIVGTETRSLVRAGGLGTGAVVSLFTMQYYLAGQAIPGRVALADVPEDPELLGAWLEKKAASRVQLHVPQRGRLRNLADIARQNAQLRLEEARTAAGGGEGAGPELYELKDVLGLSAPPMRIEGIDISTLQGTDQVASLVVFVGGRPARSAYRRYRIKGVDGADDFASIQEVVDRRVSRALDEGGPLPDLLLIDGGAGQLSAARRALDKYDRSALPTIGLAKKEEKIVLTSLRTALTLPRRSEALKLLQRVRDEAHRFALAYHRQLRTKRLSASELDEIPGVGPARKALLLKAFGSVATLRAQPMETIAALPGIGRATAQRILDTLLQPDTEDEANESVT